MSERAAMAMQRSQTKEDEQSPPRREQTASLSPGRAFVILLAALLVLGTAGYIFIGDEGPASKPVARGPGGPSESRPGPSRLTNQEAIAKFKELRRVAIEAVKARDASLLSQAFVPGSPIERRALRVIHTLQEDRVKDHSVIRLLKTGVVSKTPTEVHLSNEMLISPCFRRETGEDVTKSPDRIHQFANWTMRRVNGKWLLHDARIKDDRAEGTRAHCP
ncbi:hypothetical protein BH18ACT15_BH18ACT15_14070 [soil metagenome]